MEVFTVVVGFLETNCYVVADGETGDAVVIDPGANPQHILELVKNRKLNVKKILLTHGHTDHIGGLEELSRSLDAQVLMHEKEAEFINVPPADRRRFVSGNGKPGISVLQDGDEIAVGTIKFKTLHTPGHTPGGVCFSTDGVCFTGDTLFNDGVGRTDFEGGSSKQLMDSIKSKLLPMDDGVKIYPGHGPSSTIGHERRYF